MRTLFTNIKALLQIRGPEVQKVSGAQMRELPHIDEAFLIIENDRIMDFGKMEDLDTVNAEQVVDLTGSMLLPSWCDSHSHLVYAGNREDEFVDRIRGLSYEEIAKKGGGILNSAKLLQATNEDELYRQSAERLEEVIAQGTGAIEIKSGYGLTTEAELKMLRVIKRLGQDYPIAIKPTFLGAHAVPQPFKEQPEKYIDLIIDSMLPAIAEEKLAEFIDVFCESGYFTKEQTALLLAAGTKYNLEAKIHVNQFTVSGGITVAVQHKARSVDHLELIDNQDLESLINSDTMPVALPACSYFLGIPYTPARQLIDAGLPLALASDFNPGSSPSGNMNFVVSTACIKMSMTPEEAINAATINGAYAMNLNATHGSITRGKKANFIITKNISSLAYLPYAFGSDSIKALYLDGAKVR